jgi:hypothetical protein
VASFFMVVTLFAVRAARRYRLLKESSELVHTPASHLSQLTLPP